MGNHCNMYDYQLSLEISTHGFPFYALLAALIRKADSDNLERIRRERPTFTDEFIKRYNAPGGKLEGE